MFRSVYGARPVEALPPPLENPLAQRILAGEFGSGYTIAVEVAKGRLAFPKGERAVAGVA